MSIPNWMAKFIVLERVKQALGIPSVGHFENHIYHDERCDRMNGRGPCNCDPDILQRRVSLFPQDDG